MEEEQRDGLGPLFESRRGKNWVFHRVFSFCVFVGIVLVWVYRATHVPSRGEKGRWAWIGLFGAEVWFGFYWVLTQSLRWNPIYRCTFKHRLSQRFEDKLPRVDVFVCTADPTIEPPVMVINTVLSVMAYDYPAEKLSVYLSDDFGSKFTFYALLEASIFARSWLPFCRKFKVEPRSPAVYFSESSKILDDPKTEERVRMKVLIDGRDQTECDSGGCSLPTLVYMAREKRPEYHHNFKAGAMNALLRVSSEISNGPVILNVDCDMYSNNSESVRDALCFFMDEEKGREIAYVQFPQNFDNVTKNDLYASSLKFISDVDFHGMDGHGGPLYIGSGCFHRRESLCGKKYSEAYKAELRGDRPSIAQSNVYTLEERAKNLATCTYEENSQWGKEMGLKYGFPVEDVITGLSIQCKGWKSVYYNPQRKGFLGVAPSTLSQTLVQHKRWSEGDFQIFLSKYCPFIYGHGRISLGLQMCYSTYFFWAPNSLPILYYAIVPALFLFNGISLFPSLSSLWFISFAFVAGASFIYSIVECLCLGYTLQGWWNEQRIWLFKRTTSYLFALVDTFLKLLGVTKSAFIITAKVVDEEVSKRYENEMMEFGSSSPMFVILTTIAMLNLLCLAIGVKRMVMDEGVEILDSLLLQILICGLIVLINAPVYQALFLRSDNGRMPTNVMFASAFLVLIAYMIPMV
ncbi:cellulose synthase-like protein E6 isoform X2 [Asparagus officinalis]|uniref:cellulose synthase-like protein E6 isoform X2 n=1 Tax=Asparagus officinalis TaxID=4686 RepID=UPI00098E656A|nr:cellulose synthase-like protein E6 isoform X2 [Asparagus officinalis]